MRNARHLRHPSTRLVTGLLVGAVLGSVLVGCGVAADDRAAVVLGTPVSTEVVDTLASDDAFLQAVGGGSSGSESVVPGDSARSALTFEIQRAAAQTELARWEPELADLTGDELRRAIGFDEAQASVSAQVPPGLSDAALDQLTFFVAATTRLGERLQGLSRGASDPGGVAPEDLRRLYDGAPSLWRRTCAAVLAVGQPQASAVAGLVDAGRPLEAIVEEVEGAELAFDPARECIPTAQLPDALREQIEGAAVGATLGPVVLESQQTGPIAVFFRVEGTEQLTFDDPSVRSVLDSLVANFAAAQQPGEAAGTWLNVLLPGAVEVNPRYGRAAVSAAGSFEVVAPEAPVVLRRDAGGLPEILPVPADQLPSEQSPSEQSPSEQSPSPPGP